MLLKSMNDIALPDELKRWAEAEVAAGRAKDLSGLVAEALSEHRTLRALRASLDEAEAERGAFSLELASQRLRARFPGE